LLRKSGGIRREGKTMKKGFSLMVTMLLLTFSTGLLAQDALTLEENKILALALEKNFAGDGFTVVMPQTNISRLYYDGERVRDRESFKKTLSEKPALKGYELDALLDRLFERNSKALKLTLPSIPGNGYVVDYDGKYAAYFMEKDGWKKWRKENPQAHGYTSASIPAYDSGTGLVVLYLGTQFNVTAGGGYLIVYKFAKDKLVELARIMLWIS
jgi:hypothetical protein